MRIPLSGRKGGVVMGRQQECLPRENRLVVAKVEGLGGRMGWEFVVSRYKLLYIEWINNKVLLYSTENYIQYPMISHNGKEYI